MIHQYGHATWAAMGAFAGGVLGYGPELGPQALAVGVVVGVLFGIALRG